MANFWRVLEFDKFAGEWPLLKQIPFFSTVTHFLGVYWPRKVKFSLLVQLHKLRKIENFEVIFYIIDTFKGTLIALFLFVFKS
jgi:hypothetical protein